MFPQFLARRLHGLVLVLVFICVPGLTRVSVRAPLNSDAPTYSFAKSFKLPSQNDFEQADRVLAPIAGPIALVAAEPRPPRVCRTRPVDFVPRCLAEPPSPDGLRAPPSA